MTAPTAAYRGALEALDRILNRGGTAEDVLRAVVDLLHDRIEHYGWVAIVFAEGDGLALGPSRGRAVGTEAAVPIRYGGRAVARLVVRTPAGGRVGDEDTAFLERVALLVSAHCLAAAGSR